MYRAAAVRRIALRLPLEAHLDVVFERLVNREAIPLLGAGANHCRRTRPRPADVVLPDGRKLAMHLAKNTGYPADAPIDLVRVSQYIAVTLGTGALYDRLHEVFDRAYGPNRLHELLAALPARRRALGDRRGGVVITTNYDDMLETAFADANESFDVLTYIADGDDAGKFMHRTPDGECAVIERTNEYRGLSLDQRTVILKLHGAVDRKDPLQDSYVVTEDDYIAYLTRSDASSLLPATLSAELSRR